MAALTDTDGKPLLLAGRELEPRKPRLMLVMTRALREAIIEAIPYGDVACLAAWAGAVATVCPQVAGDAPTDLRTLSAWSVAALEKLLELGMVEGHIAAAGRAALEWLEAQAPRPAVVEDLAGNSSAQGAQTTST
jgi:hypothetical protein